MKSPGHVPARWKLADQTDIFLSSSHTCHPLTERVRDSRRTGHHESRSRLGWSEDFDSALEIACLVVQGYDSHLERQCTPVHRLVDGGEILHPLEIVVESEGQRAGVFTIDTPGRQLAATAHLLAELVPQQSTRRVVDVAKRPLMIEYDHRLAQLVEHLDPRPPHKVIWMAGHASITAKPVKIFARETVFCGPKTSSTFDLEALLGLGLRLREI
jgi:hypothetical protein